MTLSSQHGARACTPPKPTHLRSPRPPRARCHLPRLPPCRRPAAPCHISPHFKGTPNQLSWLGAGLSITKSGVRFPLKGRICGRGDPKLLKGLRIPKDTPPPRDRQSISPGGTEVRHLAASRSGGGPAESARGLRGPRPRSSGLGSGGTATLPVVTAYKIHTTL